MAINQLSLADVIAKVTNVNTTEAQAREGFNDIMTQVDNNQTAIRLVLEEISNFFEFDGDGVATTFSGTPVRYNGSTTGLVGFEYEVENLVVAVGERGAEIIQDPSTYTATSTTQVVFDNAPANGSNVVFYAIESGGGNTDLAIAIRDSSYILHPYNADTGTVDATFTASGTTLTFTGTGSEDNATEFVNEFTGTTRRVVIRNLADSSDALVISSPEPITATRTGSDIAFTSTGAIAFSPTSITTDTSAGVVKLYSDTQGQTVDRQGARFGVKFEGLDNASPRQELEYTAGEVLVTDQNGVTIPHDNIIDTDGTSVTVYGVDGGTGATGTVNIYVHDNGLEASEAGRLAKEMLNSSLFVKSTHTVTAAVETSFTVPTATVEIGADDEVIVTYDDDSEGTTDTVILDSSTDGWSRNNQVITINGTVPYAASDTVNIYVRDVASDIVGNPVDTASTTYNSLTALNSITIDGVDYRIEGTTTSGTSTSVTTLLRSEYEFRTIDAATDNVSVIGGGGTASTGRPASARTPISGSLEFLAADNLNVYLNGVHLDSNDYTSDATAHTITLNDALTTDGNTVLVEVYSTRTTNVAATTSTPTGSTTNVDVPTRVQHEFRGSQGTDDTTATPTKTGNYIFTIGGDGFAADDDLDVFVNGVHLLENNVSHEGSTETSEFSTDASNNYVILATEAEDDDVITIIVHSSESISVASSVTTTGSTTSTSLVRSEYDYTATADGQTTFSGDGLSYVVGESDVKVYRNGVLQIADNYTATSGSSIVFPADTIIEDDEIIVEVFDEESIIAPLRRTRLNFTATDGQATFTTSDDNTAFFYSNTNFTEVYLNGVLLKETDDYILSNGNTLTLNSAAQEDDVVTTIVTDSGTSFSTRQFSFTAVENQTTFSGADNSHVPLAYSEGQIIVTLNGITLQNGVDYTATDGISIVLAVGAHADDTLTVLSFDNSSDFHITLKHFNFTTTNGQTSFGGPAIADRDDDGQSLVFDGDSSIIVTLNGVTLSRGVDYTTNGENQITLTSGTAAGSDLHVVVLAGGASQGAGGDIWSLGTGTDIYYTGGNVGIGTDSPSYPLELSRGSGSNYLTLNRSNANTTGTVGGINFTASSGNSVSSIAAIGDGDDEGSHLVFRTTSDAASTDPANAASPERMRIDSSGNVAIGMTPSGDTTHEVYGVNAATVYKNSTTGSGLDDGFYVGMGKNNADIAYVYNRENDAMIFGTNNTERMRISSAGNVGIGHTNPAAPLHVRETATGLQTLARFQAPNATLNIRANSTSGYAPSFLIGNNGFEIRSGSDSRDVRVYASLNSANGVRLPAAGGTAWASTSDERRKRDFETLDTSNALQYVLDARTVKYRLNDEADDAEKRIGVIAQDLEGTDFEEAIYIDDDDDATKGVAYTELIPVLMAAIKEQQAQIETLEAQVATLMGSTDEQAQEGYTREELETMSKKEIDDLAKELFDIDLDRRKTKSNLIDEFLTAQEDN